MKKILIIEDNKEVRENLAEILELSNYNVLTAENGKIGVEIALKEIPDLILCDVMMPVLDGFGVLHILDKKPATSGIPFIFLTAKADKTDFRKGMNLGADDYITKPFDDLELLEALEMRLKKSERIKQAFDGTSSGLHSFIDEARGQKDMEQLSRAKETKKYLKKDIVYKEDDHPKYLYFIARGKVKSFKTNEIGKEYIIQIYKPGDFLGYTALLQNDTYQESSMAIEDTSINIIPKDDFLTLLHSNRNFAARFIKMLANNIEDTEAQLLSLAYSSIRKRVAEALVKLNTKTEKGSQTTINILRDDLAGMVGTAKESVIRTLTDFKQEGLIHIDNGIITILEIKKLEELPL